MWSCVSLKGKRSIEEEKKKINLKSWDDAQICCEISHCVKQMIPTGGCGWPVHRTVFLSLSITSHNCCSQGMFCRDKGISYSDGIGETQETGLWEVSNGIWSPALGLLLWCPPPCWPQPALTLWCILAQGCDSQGDSKYAGI